MESVAVLLVRALLASLRALPIRVAARVGAWGGALAYYVDARHRRVTLLNLRTAFPEWSEEQVKSVGKETFRRIGENFVCGACTARMSHEALADHVEIVGLEKVLSRPKPRNYVFAIGHFGNFELLAHLNDYLPGYCFSTTYRALRQPRLNELLVELREGSGCVTFERRTDALALRARLNEGGMALGLLSDQSDGERGLKVPFLGTEASTSTAAALFALRYQADFYTAIVYRTGLARWRVEVGERIPTEVAGRARSIKELALDMNQAFEAAVRRDPANWFWVHDRWRLARKKKLRAQSLELRA